MVNNDGILQSSFSMEQLGFLQGNGESQPVVVTEVETGF